MHPDGGPVDTIFDKEVHNICPLVTLKLEDLAELLVFDDGTVARELLLNHAKSVSGHTWE